MVESELMDWLERLDADALRRLSELLEEEKRRRWSCPRNVRFNHRARVWDRRPA